MLIDQWIQPGLAVLGASATAAMMFAGHGALPRHPSGALPTTPAGGRRGCCCGGCNLMSGRLSVTFSGLTACIHICLPHGANESCISIHSTDELNREFILDFVDSIVVDGVTYCRYEKITSGALEIDRWVEYEDSDPCFRCAIFDHDDPGYSTNSEDLIVSVLVSKDTQGNLVTNCLYMSFIDTVGDGQEYDLFLDDTASWVTTLFDNWVNNRFDNCGPWWYDPTICRTPTVPPGAPAYQYIAGAVGAAIVSQEGI